MTDPLEAERDYSLDPDVDAVMKADMGKLLAMMLGRLQQLENETARLERLLNQHTMPRATPYLWSRRWK